ncbi:unnamed protein product [Peronospora belbahrii]|uniref:Uncharacterized protein n=1 Tax=Peronospora belbahrii TaxID=622444 RepID=A0AAU9L0M9_9STRA|nr:unnamed protein product [Peronospora belbahrii]
MANRIEEMKLTNRLNPYKTRVPQLAKQLDWLDSNKKPVECFELLELNMGEENLLASPELEHFNSYLEIYNKKNPTRQVTLFGILRNRFGKKRLEDIIDAGLEDSVHQN